jgi:hypothetical protein
MNNTEGFGPLLTIRRVKMDNLALLEQLEQLKAKVSAPATYMGMVRMALKQQIDNFSIVPMPPILDEDQRKVFLQDVELLETFLKSQDGSDAVQLLLESFKEFKIAHSSAPIPPVDEVHVDKLPATE